MAARLERTNTPGIFRRHRQSCPQRGRCECSYAVPLWVKGRQVMRTFPTFAEAREAQHKGAVSPASSAFAASAKVLLADYSLAWVDRYQGTGRRGFRQETRDEYRGLLNKYALRYFPPQTMLADLDPRAVADFIGWLVKQPVKRKDAPPGTLSDRSIRNALIPLSACLATARREGLIAHNPADGATLPHRPQIEQDEERPRPFPNGVMELVVGLVHPDHRLMFELLAATGLRRSELLARRTPPAPGRRAPLRVRAPAGQETARKRARPGAAQIEAWAAGPAGPDRAGRPPESPPRDP
jgi:hypothetical protein